MDKLYSSDVIGKIPEGEFCGDYCRNCRHYGWDQSYHKYWCDFHQKWVEGSDWHECCE